MYLITCTSTYATFSIPIPCRPWHSMVISDQSRWIFKFISKVALSSSFSIFDSVGGALVNSYVRQDIQPGAIRTYQQGSSNRYRGQLFKITMLVGDRKVPEPNTQINSCLLNNITHLFITQRSPVPWLGREPFLCERYTQSTKSRGMILSRTSNSIQLATVSNTTSTETGGHTSTWAKSLKSKAFLLGCPSKTRHRLMPSTAFIPGRFPQSRLNPPSVSTFLGTNVRESLHMLQHESPKPHSSFAHQSRLLFSIRRPSLQDQRRQLIER